MTATTLTNTLSYLHEHCEAINAAIFSGDSLYLESERELLKGYVESWARAIAESEPTRTPITPPEA